MTRRAPRRTTRRVALPCLAALLLAAGCSSSDGSDGAKNTSAKDTTTPASETSSRTGNPCDDGASIADLKAAAVDGSDFAWTVTSFDGTEIRANWFPVDGATKSKPAPTLLMGPGWSMAGDTSKDGAAIFGALSISAMHAEGYNVLTWDPRGFGASTGTAQVNSKDAEGRDVQALLDFVAEQPTSQLDDEGDPRTGMVGFSYGGGIQLITAAIDCRVDALVPGIAWHSLETSLYKNKTVKAGWSGILTSAASAASLDPHIVSAAASGKATGTLSAEDEQWFRDRGPADLVKKIAVPTLFLQGTIDTLFTLDEGITNFRILQANDVPTAMLWFCGGHGTCLTDPGDAERVGKAQFAWLDRYVKGDESAPVVPAFETLDQNGNTWTADDYPTDAELTPDIATQASAPSADLTLLQGTGDGTLELTAAGGAGPLTDGVDPADPLGGVVAGITPAEATNAINVTITVGKKMTGLALGSPVLALTYRGTAPAGAGPTRLFAQLVDDATGVVIGNQITPIEVVLDGNDHTTAVPLEVIAQFVEPGDTLTLQITPTTTAYATPQLGSTVTIELATIAVPLITTLTKR